MISTRLTPILQQGLLQENGKIIFQFMTVETRVIPSGNYIEFEEKKNNTMSNYKPITYHFGIPDNMEPVPENITEYASYKDADFDCRGICLTVTVNQEQGEPEQDVRDRGIKKFMDYYRAGFLPH